MKISLDKFLNILLKTKDSLTIAQEIEFGELNAEEFHSIFKRIAPKVTELVLKNEVLITQWTKILTQKDCKVTMLRLANLDANAIQALAPTLKDKDCKVTMLRLSNLDANAIQALAPTLKDKDCKVTMLSLANLDANAIQALAPTLKDKDCKVTVLRLANLDANAIQALAPTLKDKDCKVTMLSLANLTPEARKEAEILQELIAQKNSVSEQQKTQRNVIPQTPTRQQIPTFPLTHGRNVPNSFFNTHTVVKPTAQKLPQQKRKQPPSPEPTQDVTFTGRGNLMVSQLIEPPLQKIKEEPISPPSSPTKKK
jgi:hypothetical protein